MVPGIGMLWLATGKLQLQLYTEYIQSTKIRNVKATCNLEHHRMDPTYGNG